MNKPNLNTVALPDLMFQLSNKQRAINDLTVWLSKHKNDEPEYIRVTSDRRLLDEEVQALQIEINLRNKPFVKSLNQSFEL